MGLLQAIGNALAAVIKSQPEENQLAIAITLILWVSAISSAFLDNIPYTATMIPVITILANELPDTLDIKTLAWALSFGACRKLFESFLLPRLCIHVTYDLKIDLNQSKSEETELSWELHQTLLPRELVRLKDLELRS
jgi:hypothetical protein